MPVTSTLAYHIIVLIDPVGPITELHSKRKLLSLLPVRSALACHSTEQIILEGLIIGRLPMDKLQALSANI
jgi:hypothetical protein